MAEFAAGLVFECAGVGPAILLFSCATRRQPRPRWPGTSPSIRPDQGARVRDAWLSARATNCGVPSRRTLGASRNRLLFPRGLPQKVFGWPTNPRPSESLLTIQCDAQYTSGKTVRVIAKARRTFQTSRCSCRLQGNAIVGPKGRISPGGDPQPPYPTRLAPTWRIGPASDPVAFLPHRDGACVAD